VETKLARNRFPETAEQRDSEVQMNVVVQTCSPMRAKNRALFIFTVSGQAKHQIWSFGWNLVFQIRRDAKLGTKQVWLGGQRFTDELKRALINRRDLESRSRNKCPDDALSFVASLDE
jgi:hypothetical protein